MASTAGLNPRSVSREPEFGLGQYGLDATGSEYVYVRAGGAISERGAVLQLDNDNLAVELGNANYALVRRVGVAPDAAREGDYFWAQVRGEGMAQVAANVSADMQLGPSNAAGVVGPASASDLITGISCPGGTGPMQDLVPVRLTYPITAQVRLATAGPGSLPQAPSDAASSNYVVELRSGDVEWRTLAQLLEEQLYREFAGGSLPSAGDFVRIRAVVGNRDAITLQAAELLDRDIPSSIARQSSVVALEAEADNIQARIEAQKPSLLTSDDKSILAALAEDLNHERVDSTRILVALTTSAIGENDDLSGLTWQPVASITTSSAVHYALRVPQALVRDPRPDRRAHSVHALRV